VLYVDASRELLRIRLFGPPQLSWNGAPLRFSAPIRALSLLVYLLLNRAEMKRRDAVAYALWPDTPEVEARSNLRYQLYYLSRVLPGGRDIPWIVGGKRTIQWNPAAPLWLDLVWKGFCQGACLAIFRPCISSRKMNRMGQRTISVCSTVDQTGIRGFYRMTLIRRGAASV
jgi:hypothetical protein